MMIRRILLGLIRAYRFVGSPLVDSLGVRCRFYPSCSAYAETALKLHPPITALFLITKRLCRCSPWSEGGIDHVPQEPLGEHS